ncbi:STARD3 N-terminal-like protein isoform X2 [Salmo salar]|uniref:STARD3 N-terminal-like protein isoform X2 n=1 Tax=Salmo salar TaxID=8030 RepID=A0ABM3CT75_SALSA|nr:STARD3 N-terminal-like protein isoform X2 [Salmo salar]
MESISGSSVDSRATLRGINTTPLLARIESYEASEKKCISDVRRTFCLFVTFDLLFITLLWIIELNVNGGIEKRLDKEVLHYDYHASFFDIFITTATTSAFLIAKVILSKLLSQGAFGYLLPIISFILAWIETWLLDFKVLPQEADDENRFLSIMDAPERAPFMQPGPLSDGQFYSPPESVADSDEDLLDDKHDPEKALI